MPDFDDDDDDTTTDELPAALRKQLKAKDKAMAELQKSYGEIMKRDRDRTLGETLTAKGLPAKVAKFFPADGDIATIDAWLTENEDVFGKPKEPEADQSAPEVPDAFGRLNKIGGTSANSGEADVLHNVNNAASEQDLIKMIMDAGGGAY